MGNVYDMNKSKLPDLDQFKGTNNQFLQDIYRKSSIYQLSDKQVAAAQRAWDKIQNPNKGWVKFTDDQIKIMETLFNYLSISWGGSPHSYEFMSSLREQLKNKKALSEKQVGALIRKMLKIKKAVMKHIWQGH